MLAVIGDMFTLESGGGVHAILKDVDAHTSELAGVSGRMIRLEHEGGVHAILIDVDGHVGFNAGTICDFCF